MFTGGQNEVDMVHFEQVKLTIQFLTELFWWPLKERVKQMSKYYSQCAISLFGLDPPQNKKNFI